MTKRRQQSFVGKVGVGDIIRIRHAVSKQTYVGEVLAVSTSLGDPSDIRSVTFEDILTGEEHIFFDNGYARILENIGKQRK